RAPPRDLPQLRLPQGQAHLDRLREAHPRRRSPPRAPRRAGPVRTAAGVAMSAIGKDEGEELALLARLKLTDEETARAPGELTAILGYVEQLQAVDTAGVEPMTHAVPLDNPLRPDQVAPSFSVEEALADAPERAEELFVVPRILPVET